MAEAVVVAALSLPAFWVAGQFGLWWIAAVASASVGAAFIFASSLNDARAVRNSDEILDPSVDNISPAARSAAMNATYIGGVFLWGALALVGGYGLTGLYWQHWWQYAAAMVLLAAVALGYAAFLPRPGSVWAGPAWLSRMTRLTLAQGVAAGAGLAFLIGSGKLVADKPDWLANQVFLFGGIAIAVLSAIAVRAQWRHLRSGAADVVIGETRR